MSAESEVIAFFDIDKTMIDVNSAKLWMLREFRAGRLSSGQLVRASWMLLRYSLGRVDLQEGLREAISTLKGMEERVVVERTAAFFREEVAATIRQEAVAAVARHRAEGHHVVTLTSASNYMAQLLGEHVPFDGHLATHFDVVDGHFSGEPDGDICFGSGKVSKARAYCEMHGFKLEDAFFYSDSYTDLPMFEVVAHPVVVSPDRRLERLARKRAWPIENWQTRVVEVSPDRVTL